MTDTSKRDEFADKAEGRSSTLLGEVWGFLRENKKWWLLPIVLTMLLLGLLVVLGGSGAAPFIYTLF
jgi:hypothetical protein